MNYNTLTAAKGSPGSIANWVGYGKLDIATVLDEAQSIIFQSLRVREMRKLFTFGMAIGQSSVPLPTGFLDPIGRIADSRGLEYSHRIESEVVRRRSFQAVSGGALPNNAFTTGAVSSQLVTVNIPAHGLTQGSNAIFAGVSTVDGLTLNGTFPVVTVPDVNTIIIDAGAEPAAGNVNGGGAAGSWTANVLIASSPRIWSIFDEAIQWDAAAVTAFQGQLLYYKSPPLLSATNPTNFLTSRFPRLIREATNAAAASFMKDDNEEQKALQKLGQLIDATNAESDLIYRGADFGTETPHASGHL
jgi:hypothetical protein